MYLIKLLGRFLGTILVWVIVLISPYSRYLRIRVHLTSGKVLRIKFLIPTKESEGERKMIESLTEDEIYAEDMRTYKLSESDLLRKKMLNLNPKHIAAVEVIRC